MKQIGNLLYWEMSEVRTSPEDLRTIGIESFLPRNDYKSALIKALKEFTKKTSRFPKRFNDIAESVQFSVFYEEISGEELTLEKQITIKLDKETGILQGADGTELLKLYDQEKKSINTQQLRTILLKTLAHECHSVSMRNGGGIYFIKQEFVNKMEEIREKFSRIDGVKFHNVPIYDDKGTLDAVSEATESDLLSEIQTIIGTIQREFEKGDLSSKRLEGKTSQIDEVMVKLKIHKESLREKYDDLEKKLQLIDQTVQENISRVQEGLDMTENFLDRLKAI